MILAVDVSVVNKVTSSVSCKLHDHVDQLRRSGRCPLGILIWNVTMGIMSVTHCCCVFQMWNECLFISVLTLTLVSLTSTWSYMRCLFQLLARYIVRDNDKPQLSENWRVYISHLKLTTGVNFMTCESLTLRRYRWWAVIRYVYHSIDRHHSLLLYIKHVISVSRENFKDERPITDLKSAAKDVPPDDPAAFFGHPLTAASTAINGEDSHANGAALYHEYMNLGPIVPVEGKGEQLFDMRWVWRHPFMTSSILIIDDPQHTSPWIEI